METQFDLIVIGAGPGGYEAALHAAKAGLRTALVERRELGGTCLNRGCIPTKALLHASGLYREAVEASRFGVRIDGAAVDLPAIFARKEAVVEKLRSGVEAMLKTAKVTILYGTGTVLGPGRIRVANAEGETVCTCEHILAATGSVPAKPPIPGLELTLDSDALLEGADRLFDSLTVIGGGAIGVELASFYADLGVPVTILEGLDRLLPNLDRELGQSLGLLLKKHGVTVLTGAMVQRVERGENGLTVHYLQKEQPGSVASEAVLCAIGRTPYTEGLFAPELQPEFERRRLKVDAQFRTSIPGVYAIGDLSSPVQLAHAATAQGLACVDGILGRTPDRALSLIPGCVYTRPEIAAVGLSEAEAKAQGIPVRSAKALTSANGRTVILNGERGFLKLLAHAETGRLLGAALLCERAGEIISELSVAIANGLTVRELLRVVRPHPSFEEALNTALAELDKKLNS